MHVPLLVLGPTLVMFESTTGGTSGSFSASRPSQKSEGKDSNRATTCCQEVRKGLFLEKYANDHIVIF